MTTIAAPASYVPTRAQDLATKGYVDSSNPTASSTTAGHTRYSTDAETATGTVTNAATTPANVRAVTGDPETNYVSIFEAALV